MLKERIKRYLQKGEYQDGVKLYAQLPKCNTRLLSLFFKKENERNKAKLDYELKKALSSIKSNSKSTIEVFTGTDIQLKNGNVAVRRVDKTFPEKMPFAVQQVADEIKLKYRERNHLHAQLLFFDTNEERYEAAIKIKGLTDDIAAHWHEYDKWKKEGVEPLNLKQQEVVDGVVRAYNLRSYIPRQKKLVKNAKTEEERAKYQKKLDSFQAELDTLDTKYNLN